MKRLTAALLALVLFVNILPIAGAFSDDGSIGKNYKAAVTATSDRKIISGFTDGSFKPAETLTRAQAAKILCVMLEGSEKADALTKTDTGFSDVPATHWAAKFVAYCVEKEIVAGVGNGRFDPDGTLSCAAFAKMLLVAYGADSAKFTGAEWMKAVEEAAPTVFLENGIEGFNGRSLPRQEAAQMAYNALYCAEATEAKKTAAPAGALPTAVPEKIKILAIGNSFSNDCTLGYLARMLKSVGVKELTLGNMYHSGCTLQKHVGYALAKEKAYQYYKWTETSGKWTSPKKNTSTLDDPLKDEQWDIISIQQGASRSGVVEYYHPAMEMLLHYVRQRQPGAVFVWNAVWTEANHRKKKTEIFKTLYDGDELKMYDAYCAATQSEVLAEPRFAAVLPVCTAIQNARTSFIGDHTDRDGDHLNKGIGRYIASMVWCCRLTGVSPDQITYLPEALVQDKKDFTIPGLDMKAPGLLEALGKVARESVKNALAKPFEITQSQYTTAPG